jgi:P2 family phage contractile tail tube protein
MADIPKVIKNFNVFVDGRGFAGKVDEITLPDLELTIEEHRAGGMDGVAPLDMGQELMELEFVSAEHNSNLLKLWGLQSSNAARLTFRAAMVDDIEVIPYVVNVSGMFTIMSPGTIQNGQKSPLTATMNLRFYELLIGNEEIYHIDVVNMVRRVGGVDRLALQRAALGL